MAGGTYGGQLRRTDAVAKGTAGGGCDRYANDIAGCINFVPDDRGAVTWSRREIRIEVPYVHLKGLTIPPNPHGDVYAGVNDTSTNVKGIWLDSVNIPQFFATNLDGFAITDSRVGPCVTSASYSTCDSQIKGGYQATDTPTLEHDILIDNVTFHDTWRTGTQDHLECLLVFDAKNITVRNSAFQNCGIIDFFLASTSGHPLSNALVENTVFDRPGLARADVTLEPDDIGVARCPVRPPLLEHHRPQQQLRLGRADDHPEPRRHIRRNGHLHGQRERWLDRL